jgi:rubrerythrin
MSLLRNEPPAPMRTLDEFFAVAHALEEEASARYAVLADQMRILDLPDVAAVFERLAVEERGHADKVEGWAGSVIGAAPDPAWIRWQPPETFDEEEARAMATSSLASAYRALSMAVRNEERAFALWTYIAAQAEDSAIQAAAERMAGEELHHAALLRRERRRAFHAERRHRDATTAPATQRLPPAEETARIEQALGALLSALAEGDAAADQASELRRLAAEALEMASAAVTEDSGVAAHRRDDVPQLEGDAPDGLPKALRLGERAVEAYLDAGDAAQEEAEMRRFQSLAERSIARLALLRRMAGDG